MSIHWRAVEAGSPSSSACALSPPQHNLTRGSQGPWVPRGLTQALESMEVQECVWVGVRENEKEARCSLVPWPVFKPWGRSLPQPPAHPCPGQAPGVRWECRMAPSKAFPGGWFGFVSFGFFTSSARSPRSISTNTGGFCGWKPKRRGWWAWVSQGDTQIPGRERGLWARGGQGLGITLRPPDTGRVWRDLLAVWLMRCPLAEGGDGCGLPSPCSPPIRSLRTQRVSPTFAP